MPSSQNGWVVLPSTSKQLYRWMLPCGVGFTLREGATGFILAYIGETIHQKVEHITVGTDDYGYARRLIRGSTNTWSNHSSGTAMDLNSLQHPLGALNTWTPKESRRIRKLLREVYGVVRWGEDYQHRKDGMHFEIASDRVTVEMTARVLAVSKIGESILAANPKQREVLYL